MTASLDCSARQTESDHLLEVRGIDLSYGPLQVLFDIDLSIARGEVLALLGTNGAGKSSLLRAITGLTVPTAGRVMLGDHDVTALPAEERVQRGIVQVPGGKAIFPSLTVDENLRLGAFLLRKDREEVERRKAKVFDLFPILGNRLQQAAGSLSGGERQMLAIAKGLLLEPELLCIDELSLGLAPLAVDELLGVVEQLRTAGTTMLIVEQSVNIALSLTDRAVFLEKGHVRFEGASRELLKRDDLARAVFLGGDIR